MNEKNILRDDILLKMQNYIGSTEMAILENILNESLYNVDVYTKNNTLPSTVDNSNNYILNLFQLRRGMKLSAKTMKAYMITAREFIRIIDMPLTQVTSEDIEYYLAVKKKNGCKNTTLNNALRNVKALFEFMKNHRFISENPADYIEVFKEEKKIVDYLDAVAFDKLRSACEDYRDRALLEWLRSTAVRVGEIPNITINQIDWSTGRVVIYGEKTYTERIVYVDSLAIQYLKQYIIKQRGLDLDSTLPLFACSRGDKTQPLTDKGVQAIIRRLGKRSGLNRRIYPHLFRKTTATNVVIRGGTVDEAGIYLGHAANSVTAKYYVGTQEDTVKYIHHRYVKAV